MKLSTTSAFQSGEVQSNKDEQVKSDVLPSKKKEKHELASLVKSIKMKSKQTQLPANSTMVKKDKKVQYAGVPETGRLDDLSTLVRSVKRKSRSLRK